MGMVEGFIQINVVGKRMWCVNKQKVKSTYQDSTRKSNEIPELER